MDTRRLEMGPVMGLEAQSFGEPGSRTFRLRLVQPAGEVSLWVEKEQLVLLGAAIEELLERIRPTTDPPQTSDQTPNFSGDLEVKAGSLSLGHDAESQYFSLEASDFLSDIYFESVHVRPTRSQLQAVQAQIEEISKGGRPRCLLCGRPLTGEPHFCPESNGHADFSEEA